MTGLGGPLAAAVLPPPPRPPLPGFGGTAGSSPGPGLAVAQVQAALHADRPPRHQQPVSVRARDRVRVDDSQVDPCHAFRVGGLAVGVAGHRDLGGHVDLQPPPVEQQRHRPDLLRGVGDVPVQPHHQRRAAPRDREAQHQGVQRERARIPADRHQAPAPPREPRRQIPVLAALSGLARKLVGGSCCQVVGLGLVVGIDAA